MSAMRACRPACQCHRRTRLCAMSTIIHRWCTMSASTRCGTHRSGTRSCFVAQQLQLLKRASLFCLSSCSSCANESHAEAHQHCLMRAEHDRRIGIQGLRGVHVRVEHRGVSVSQHMPRSRRPRRWRPPRKQARVRVRQMLHAQAARSSSCSSFGFAVRSLHMPRCPCFPVCLQRCLCRSGRQRRVCLYYRQH